MSKDDKKAKGRLGFWVAGAGLLISSSLHAGIPVWTYSAPNPASVTIADGGTATVQYTVTNQSHKAKNLILRPTSGLSASACYLASKGSTCNVTLTINGSKVPKEGIHAGPILCEQSNPSQCYQPSAANVLNVVKSAAPPVTNAVISGTPTSFSLTQGGSSQVVTITNNGPVDAYGVGVSSAPGLGVTVSGACASPMAPNDTCQLTFTSGSNTGNTTATIAGSNTNSITEDINVTTALATTLSVSISSTPPAVIAVNGTGVTLSIQNTGTDTAYNVIYTLPSGWNGVSTTGSCGNIAPSASCSLTFTTTQPNVTNTIGFSADNVTPTVQSPAIAFSYQGYLVYAVTPTSTTEGTAYVVYDSDSTGVQWDSTGCNTGSGTSTCAQTSATSLTDGQYLNSSGNTFNIIDSIGTQNPPNATNAAGVCYNITTSSGNTVLQGTWYLPSICELSGNVVSSSFCPPGTDNIYGNLFLHDLGGFTNNAYYWSSTEYSGTTGSRCPTAGACAWEVFFRVSPVGPQFQLPKSIGDRVRCAQAITY